MPDRLPRVPQLLQQPLLAVVTLVLLVPLIHPIQEEGCQPAGTATTSELVEPVGVGEGFGVLASCAHHARLRCRCGGDHRLCGGAPIYPAARAGELDNSTHKLWPTESCCMSHDGYCAALF